MDFKSLSKQHIAANARLFANRFDMLRSLGGQKRVAEVGVAFGDLSTFLVKFVAKEKLYLIDLYNLHHQKTLWGRSSAEIFSGRSHLEFVRDRFRKERADGLVEIVQSDSSTFLNSLPDASMDLIYIDGDHMYEGVLKDTQAAARKLRSDGYLVFNDYIAFDHLAGIQLGVVQVVNDLCLSGEWKIVAMGLHPQMFNDVVLVRAS